MAFSKNHMAPVYLETMDVHLKKIEQFIDSVRSAIDQSTRDSVEKKYRLDLFNAFLLKATYDDSSSFKSAFIENFPSLDDPTIKYIYANLCEINGLCKEAFSDDHKDYQTLYETITFLVPDIKQSVRRQLSKKITDLIFEKTETKTQSLGKGSGHI